MIPTSESRGCSTTLTILSNKVKDSFLNVNSQNVTFEKKLQADIQSQNEAIKNMKSLFCLLEDKTVRIDNLIGKNNLKFQNYVNWVENQKWDEKHKKEEVDDAVSTAVVKKIEEMMDTVALKVHRHSDDQIQLQEKIGDLDTKVILLCQAAKNSIDGKDNSHMFDGIGDVVSAVDHFKDMIKTQYAKLSEFKETEKQVEYLNNFYMESQKQKRQSTKIEKRCLKNFKTWRLLRIGYLMRWQT